ncbi:MAG TPA: hypothetical protein DD473_28540 [Planctomycetaceae bacterium]|nr:hypothetical protein [Planctomycetaceae bacterium]
MSYQETINQSRQKTGAPERRIQRNVSAFLHNVIELFELQGKLLAVDLRDSTNSLKLPAALLIVGMCLFLGMIPVFLGGLAFYLHQQAEWSLGASLMSVASLATMIAAALCYAGFRLSASGIGLLRRSQEELKENIAWIKSALVETDSVGLSPGEAARRRYSRF